MTEMRRVLFLAIKPNYASAILAGTKSVELRRQKPSVAPGDIVVVYASGRVRAIIALFRIDEVLVGSPTRIWAEVGEDAAVTRSVFRGYFSGARRAVALRVGERSALRDPVTLEDMRAAISGFNPPQSFRYMRLAGSGLRRRLIMSGDRGVDLELDNPMVLVNDAGVV